MNSCGIVLKWCTERNKAGRSVNMVISPLVEEDMDIGLYGDEPEEPALPRKKVIWCGVSFVCFRISF